MKTNCTRPTYSIVISRFHFHYFYFYLTHYDMKIENISPKMLIHRSKIVFDNIAVYNHYSILFIFVLFFNSVFNQNCYEIFLYCFPIFLNFLYFSQPKILFPLLYLSLIFYVFPPFLFFANNLR